MTGASAGNVNALVAAVNWCTRSAQGETEIPAEKSLFWTFWVNTGVEELMPAVWKDNPEPAIFDRRFFLDRQRKQLDEFLIGATLWSRCGLPVGLTMTKQTPAELRLSETGGATRVQRFAGVFEINTIGNKLTVMAPVDAEGAAGALGALAMPPKDANCAGEAHGLDWAFNTMMASSSFPVVFAPRRVCYEASGLNAEGVQRDLFADGGVFDNNPAGLALGLGDTYSKAQFSRLPFASQQVVKELKDVDVFYTTATNPRGPLREARRSTAPQQDVFGLAGTLRLFSGGVSAAREYELQTLMRQVQRDERLLKLPRTVRFFPSSRSGEIVGETLAGFGAFLGRPFREYDFYSGIYDGLYFMAKYACGEEPECDPKDAVRNWIFSDLLKLSEDARLVVEWRKALEESPGVPMLYEDWKGRLKTPAQKLLFAIHTQISNLAARRGVQDAQSCSGPRDMIGGILCGGGMDRILGGLANDKRIESVLEDKKSGVAPAFVELLKAPRRTVNSLIEEAMGRLHYQETELRREQAEYGSWVEAALLVYRGQSYRYRTGLKWNPSSGHVEGGSFQGFAASAANIALPNYVTVGMFGDKERRPQLTFGWRPLVWRPSEKFYLGSVVEFANLDERTLQWRQNTYGFTLGSYAVPLPVAKSLELGWLSTRVAGGDRDHFLSATFRMLADKVHVNVRVKTARPGRAVYVNAGISDVNGLFFWWFR
ncbi:MAG: patatin-like phospholipase family protein [Acidobacteria bacterium]|nr:patatin-like phospholipase family protein [Acidobacteriota bacterium]